MAPWQNTPDYSATHKLCRGDDYLHAAGCCMRGRAALSKLHNRSVLTQAASLHAAPAASNCTQIGSAIDKINGIMNSATKAMTATITLDCGGVFTGCADTMSLAWSSSSAKPPGLKLAIAADASCKEGPSRPLLSSTNASPSEDYLFRSDYVSATCVNGTPQLMGRASLNLKPHCSLAPTSWTPAPLQPQQIPPAQIGLTVEGIRFDGLGAYGAMFMFVDSYSASTVTIKVWGRVERT